MSVLEQIKEELSIDWARLGPFSACSKLGLKCERSSRGAMVCCPWHAENTPSCHIIIGQQATLQVHCFACEQTWDIHSLYAQIHGMLLTGSGFVDVLVAEAETLGRWDIVDSLEGRVSGKPTLPRAPRVPPQQPAPAPTPEPVYPNVDQLLNFLGALVMPTQEETVSLHLRQRGIDPQTVAIRGLALAIPDKAPTGGWPQWARYQGLSWVETGHWLILPVYDHLGQVRSVRAWRVVPGDTPKRLPPSGHKTGGLIMADPTGIDLLRTGCWPEGNPNPPRIVICEGEPDFLSMSILVPLGSPPKAAVLGIYSGSWCADIASRIPTGTTVSIRTDADAAGDKYAMKILASLKSRCIVLRKRDET